MCPFYKLITNCKECGGGHICSHGRIKYQCKDCGCRRICVHGRIKYQCKDCGGSSLCAHNRQKSTCKECGELGHWSGDPECSKKQPREGYITELADGFEESPVRDVWMASPGAGAETAIDSGKGVVDTACRCSVAGDRWYSDYCKILANHGLDEYITETAEKERYRFGNGGILESTVRATCPAALAGRAYLITFSVVKSERLTLLLGRDLLEPLGATLDTKHSVLRIGSGKSD